MPMANYAESATSVGVVGAGVMGEALIAALIRFGISPTEILFAEKRQVRADELVARYAITHTTLASVVGASSVILLVVKPQDMQAVLNEIKEHLNPKTLVISFAAGKKIDFIEDAIQFRVIGPGGIFTTSVVNLESTLNISCVNSGEAQVAAVEASGKC